VNLLRTAYLRWQVLVHEVAKFGIVGAICYFIDVGLYNVFHAAFGWGPLTSKALSTIIAATCAYLGNRHWSFYHRARTGVRREYTLFIVLNAIGLLIALACLGFAYYVLGLTSLFAQNIAGNVIGTGLGTMFRFWAYKRYVFLHPDHPKARQVPAVSEEVALQEAIDTAPALDGAAVTAAAAAAAIEASQGASHRRRRRPFPHESASDLTRSA
jgi:putative flippase GtrA